MSDPDAVLREVLEPILREAVVVLSAPAEPPGDEKERLAARLSACAEAAQASLGERAREDRVHRIIGAAASSAMALTLGAGVVPQPEVVSRLEEGLELLAAGSWPPEDQDPADECRGGTAVDRGDGAVPGARRFDHPGPPEAVQRRGTRSVRSANKEST